VEPREELSDFLRSRRGRLTPDELGLRSYGARRVPGLRREELAQLAGVSADYYTRLEQGRGVHPSRSVLDAIARALQLDQAEASHLRRRTRAVLPVTWQTPLRHRHLQKKRAKLKSSKT